MKSGKCVQCGKEGSLSGFYEVNQRIYCEPCANTEVERLRAMQAPINASSLVDGTVCGVCGADWGKNELPKAGAVPYCPACHDKIYRRGFPGWLKAGLAFALVLLAFSLVHGAKYFRAGLAKARGEKLVKQKQYAAAARELQKAVAVAPNCEECILLTAKAELLAGDPQQAYRRVSSYNGGKFKDNALSKEVDGLFERASKALELSKKSAEAYQQKDPETALRLIREAQKTFPEWPDFQVNAAILKAGIAFDHKDYDGFLAASEEGYRLAPQQPAAAAQVASALACKYVTTGDETYRRRAEQMIAKAGMLAQASADDRARIDEYAQRIHYRMDAKVIIDKDEYDRTVRHAAAQPRS